MVPRIRFAHLPTPVEQLPRLSSVLGGPQILVKRDDQTGLAFGGNKTRKLEFLMAEAKGLGADVLVSAGAFQSNHCRQTAAAAAKFGLGCVLVLTGEEPEQASANFLLDQIFGAEIVAVKDRADRDRVLTETTDRLRAEGRRPYLVPYGGSSPTGALGYAFAVEELMQQDVRPDWIVFATSSGGTHAGLVLGQRAFGYEGKIIGISIDESIDWLQAHVSQLAADASAMLGPRMEIAPAQVLANADYCKSGYGVVTAAEQEAVRLFARTEGILLDPVYTGRAAAGMIDLVRRGYFKSSETVLFWHTGGQPALFADRYAHMMTEGKPETS
ncbi:MAG TPA: D-cysteine desulfhydrase family protein [Anaerolineales bacterium]